MTIIVACKGQLTPVGVTVFNVLSGCLLLSFQYKRTRCMPPTKVKQGLAGTRAASCQKLNSMKALITRKCAVKNFLLWNVLIFFVHPGK